MRKFAIVAEYPKCDFCKEQGVDKDAHYDGRTVNGMWAFMCMEHFSLVGTGLGTGFGQRLILTTKEEDIEDN